MSAVIGSQGSAAPATGFAVPGAAGRPSTVAFVFAVAVTLLLAFRTPFSANISFGVALAFLAFPVTLRPWFSSRSGIAVTAIAGLALIGGALLIEPGLNADPGRYFNPGIATYQASILVGLVLSAAAAAWALTVLGLNRFLILWAVGLIGSAPLMSDGFAENPWKYGLALPVSVLVLSLVSRGGPVLNMTALAVLVVISTLFSYRSWVQVLVAGAVVIYVLRTSRERPGRPRRSRVLVGIALGAGVLAFSWLLSTLATEGVLGEAVQRRTVEQSNVTGNLLLGARPEWAAAWSLAERHPFGLGLGVSPSSTDWSTAVRAMPFSNSALQDSGTVSGYFRSGEVSFHSVLWTFWGTYGVLGFALVVVVVLLIGKTLLSLDSLRLSTPFMAAVAVLMIGAAWDLLFSPLTLAPLAATLAVIAWLPREAERRRNSEFEWSEYT
ncbi:hypothetical protein IWX78_000207 [Mycetocola sp. CAN_C7]|uniref:hypothetical protein n=1 Tax=Mycetocola sp. CAN_C7 TaxID=2787724 RepID=UPI0018CA7C62